MNHLNIVSEQLRQVAWLITAASSSKIHKQRTHTGKIQCICRRRVSIIYMYHCYHCGLWLCPKCAAEHFGERSSVPAHKEN